MRAAGAFGNLVPIQIDQVCTEPRPRVWQGRRLAVSIDLIMRPALRANQPAAVPVDEASTVEIESETVSPATVAVGGELAAHVMWKARPLHLRPVHWERLLIAQFPLFKIERAQYPAHLRRARQSRADDQNAEDDKGAAHSPIMSLSADSHSGLHKWNHWQG